MFDVDAKEVYVAVLGLAGKKIMATIGDTKAAFSISDFSELVMLAIEELDGI